MSECASSLFKEFTSIISFGGSLSDTGNRLYVQPDHPVGRYPYGETFFHYPTGRFCDGRLINDFLAEEMGIPYLPAYLPAVGNKSVEAKKGMNFAVGGATAISAKFFAERGVILDSEFSLTVQIRWFEQILPLLCRGATERDCKDEFKRTIFMVGEFGGNDITDTLFQGWGTDQTESIILPKVTEAIELGLETLIKHGATTIVVPGILPIGCDAAYLFKFQSSNMEDYDDTGCLIKYNNIAEHHSHLLNIMLDKLRQRHPQTTILFADFYNPVKRLYDLRQVNGFGEGGLKVCCGNSNEGCGQSANIKVCKDPSSYIGWDGIHLTEAAYQRIASFLMLNLSASLDHSIAPPSNENGEIYWE